jgi:YYY domain-containing protein
VVALDDRQLLSALGQALAGAETIVLPTPNTSGDFGELTTLERSDRLADFNWWWPSRSLWDEYQGAERRYTITEFPFFSFWLGDMHPHVMALPFGLLAAGLALATLARPAPPVFVRDTAGWIDLLIAGLVLGSLYTINSWDLPTYLLLYAGAFWLLYLRVGSGYVDWGGWLRGLGLVLLTAFGLFLPFYLTFRSLVGGAAPLIDLPVLGRLTSILAPYPASRSEWHAFLIIFGLFIVPLIGFVYLARASDRSAQSVDTQEETSTPAESPAAEVADRASKAVPPAHLRWLLWLPVLLLIAGLLVGFPLLGLAGLGVLALVRAAALRDEPGPSFALLATALGCAIVFGVEVVYIRDVFEGWSARMNTVFKFYYQVWLIWGVLAPFGLWWMFVRGRRTTAFLVTVLMLPLLAGALVYPGVNLSRLLAEGTWAGLAGYTPREAEPAGAAAIAWLREHVAAGSVVLESGEIALPDGSRVGGSYNGEGFGGVAAATGFPTVIGWIGHENQWRGGDPEVLNQLEPRRADVQTLYSTTDQRQALELIERYGIDYVYVGELERRYYAGEGLAKFADLGELVFEQGEVQIYRMRRE